MPGLIDMSYEGLKTQTDERDDATLVELAIRNGPEGFGAIVSRYKDAVFGVTLSRLRNFHDAEDLTQTTLVEAFTRLERLRDPRGLGPWLRTIAINQCINFLKRRNRVVDFETIAEPISEEPSPQLEFEKAELREQVMKAIGKLSKTQRETVTLYYISEYSLTEVASIQEVPVGTVKRRLHEARKQLKEEMIEMVEDVLKENAPDGAMADRVFGLLCSYPPGGRFFSRETVQTLEQIGEPGKEGFVRALEFPHWRSRLMAVAYLGKRYEQGGPPNDFALDLLKKALQDSNRGVRMKAAASLLYGNLKIDKEIIAQVLKLLYDPSRHVRHSVLFWLWWWSTRWAKSKADVRQALPLDEICRAMIREHHPDTLGRFQLLIREILEAQGDEQKAVL